MSFFKNPDMQYIMTEETPKYFGIRNDKHQIIV